MRPASILRSAGLSLPRLKTAVLGDPEVVEDAAEAVRALGPGAVVGALAAGGGGRDELLVGEQPLGATYEMRQRERRILHETLHVGSPFSPGRGRGTVAP